MRYRLKILRLEDSKIIYLSIQICHSERSEESHTHTLQKEDASLRSA
jgi:hypothetical protein